MHFSQYSEKIIKKVGYFSKNLLTNKIQYGIFKVQEAKGKTKKEKTKIDEIKNLRLKKEMEDTPMQNHEEPFHYMTCRYENGKIARVLCMAVGL